MPAGTSGTTFLLLPFNTLMSALNSYSSVNMCQKGIIIMVVCVCVSVHKLDLEGRCKFSVGTLFVGGLVFLILNYRCVGLFVNHLCTLNVSCQPQLVVQQEFTILGKPTIMY